MMSKENEMWQVCPQDECDNDPLLGIIIGNQTHNYCCQKGFEKSLKSFEKTQSNMGYDEKGEMVYI